MRTRRAFLVCVLLLGWLAVGPAAAAPGATFVVNNAADGDDGVCDAAHCTLREAINAANLNPGPDLISFNILAGGVPTINVGSSGLGPLPSITDPVTIDGTTQGAGKVELNGAAAGAEADGVLVEAGQTTLRGLVINRFGGAGVHLLTGGNNVVEGCLIGTDTTGATAQANGGAGILIQNSGGNRIGGTTQAARNVVSGNGAPDAGVAGIEIIERLATANVVQGNIIGLNAAGTAKLGNQGDGVRIVGTANNVIGGTAAGAGNIISGNGGAGIRFQTLDATGNRVEGNLIGTNLAGTAALGNGGAGIFHEGARNNTLGGTAAGARNVVSGNGSDGLTVIGNGVTVQGNYVGVDASGAAGLPNGGAGIGVTDAFNVTVGGTSAQARNVVSGNALGGIAITRSNAVVVQGNYIGVDASGAGALGNVGIGVVLIQSSSNQIGGTGAGAGNVIANNSLAGIVVTVSGTANSIRGNSIDANGGLGIDLGGDGVTPNDPNDADAGVNNLQNFPILTSAQPTGGVAITGLLNSRPNVTFNLDFYASPTCDAKGFGEGRTYLGSTGITTNAGGNAGFSVNLPVSVTTNHAVTATATDATGNTSEFSRCILMGQTLALVTVQGKVDLQARSDDSLSKVEAGGVFVYTQLDGSFNLTLPSGEYTLTASHSQYLAAQRALSVGVSPITLPMVFLLGGDTNNDGKINLPDLVTIGASYGSAVTPGGPGDIDGSGVIDLPDLTMVGANYGLTAPRPWP